MLFEHHGASKNSFQIHRPSYDYLRLPPRIKLLRNDRLLHSSLVRAVPHHRRHPLRLRHHLHHHFDWIDMFVRGCQVLKHLRQSYWYRLGVCLDLTLQISHFVKRLHPYWQHRQENLLHFQLYLRLAYLQKRLLCHWNLKWCYGVGSRARQSSSWLHQAWADSHEADSKGAHQFWEWQFSGFHPATFAIVQLEQQSVDLRLLPSSCLAISLQKDILWLCSVKK